MTMTNGFYPSDEDEIGGPMCISNGYRWNMPVVTYGFDKSFLDYFGTNGMAAVNSAIAVLNTLPPASQLDPNNFTAGTTYYNHAAQSQGLIDLKSETLFLLLERLGLGAPGVGVFCLKDFWFTNGAIAGDVLQRNYDPLTDLPSDYIGGTLFTYQLQYSAYGEETNAWPVAFPVDPLTLSSSPVANGVPEAGAFFSGLTSDDVGGLRYLLSTNNVRYETLLPDVHGVSANSFVDGAWRPGINKITFVLQPAGSSSGACLPMTNQFVDTYIANGSAAQQQLERITTQPDILFCATNLAGSSYWFSRTDTAGWINNAASNGNASNAGPGNIAPPVRITFSKLGPQWESFRGSSEELAYDLTTRWGAFDGTTNAPIVFSQFQTGANQNPIQTPVRLLFSGNNSFSQHDWLVGGAAGASFNFQTSTNLIDWVTLFVVTNDGSINSYFNSTPNSPQRFYRIVP